VARDDWYRNTSWNEEIADEFFAKLSRARSQRDQYLVIQALSLAKHHPDIALELVEHYFETRTEDFHDMRALLARANAYLTLKDLSKAVETYKAVLAREEAFPQNRSNTYVELPYLIAKNRIADEYEFALDLLQGHADEPAFPLDRFWWHASRALILAEQGHEQAAKEHARYAIKEANIRKSGLRYHQDIGLVGEDDQAIVKKLYRLGA